MLHFTPQIWINNSWQGNTQVFATQLEAECAAFYLLDGCMEATDYRAVPTHEPVNSVIATPVPEMRWRTSNQ